ncbi:MAG: MATE family efflux transporter [Bacteroidales bacterium]|nr:MATE family efflux transporter [Bacteroidales bacterium]
MKKDNYTLLTTGPVGKVILQMAVPTVISMLITSVYNMVDTFYVGLINTQATAAVGVVFPAMTVIQAFGFFFGQGSGTYISRKLGAQQTEHASKMAATALIFSFLFGVIGATLGLIFLKPLSIALGSTPTILPYTEKFLGIILLGSPFMTGALTLNNQIRFQGNAAYSMIGILSGAILNVVAVPLFAFGLKMGITGAAIGTVLGQILSFIVLLAMTYKGNNIRFRFSDFSLESVYLKEIFKGGTPSLTRQGLASVSTLMLNIAAGVYGDAAIAGMSIVSRLTFVIFSVIIGIGQGFQPLCGFSYGAGLYDRVREGFKFCIKTGMCFLIPICVLGFIFAEQVVDLMRHDPEVVKVGAAALRWQIITYPIAALITVCNMTLQTSGRSIPANILAACRNGIFFIPLILILPHIFGLRGVEMCQMVADLFSIMVAIPLMFSYFRSIRSK